MGWLELHSEALCVLYLTALLHGYMQNVSVPQIFGCHSFPFEKVNGIVHSTHLSNNRFVPAES